MKDLFENVKVGIFSDLINEGCVLVILNVNGVIKLKEGVGFNGMVVDVVENFKNIIFESIDLLNLVKVYDEKDIVMVFCYLVYLEFVGLIMKDVILLEDKEVSKYYVL